MPREIVTIAHGSGGIRFSFGNSSSTGFSNVEYLAEAYAQAVLTQRSNERQFAAIRDAVNRVDRMTELDPHAKALIAELRKILDEDVPF